MINLTLGKKNHKEDQLIQVKPSSQPKLVNEDKSKRTINSRHYKNEDGTYTMEYSSLPLHYYDTSSKTFEEIDNTIVANDNSLNIFKNNFNVNFASELTSDNLFKMTKDNKIVTFRYNGKIGANKKSNFNRSKAKYKNDNQLINNLTYNEIAPGIDLEYIISYNHLKENIIIKEKQESYEFEFIMAIHGLKAELGSDGKCIELIDENKQIKFTIPSPVMFDGKGDKSYDVTYEFEEITDNQLKLIIIADKQWINAEERTLPVKIDPQIIATINSNIRHYTIEDGRINQSFTEAHIGEEQSEIPTPKVYHHLINILLEEFMDLVPISIVEAKLVFSLLSLSNTSTMIKMLDYPPLKIKKPHSEQYLINTFAYDSAIGKPMGNFIIKTSIEDYSIDVSNALIKWVNNHEDYGAIVLSGQTTGKAIISLPTFLITYRIKTDYPNHYLALGKGVTVELFSSKHFEIEGISEGEGVLTTYTDQTNNRIYQHYQINNQIYLRENYDTSTWNEWKNLSDSSENNSDIILKDRRDNNFQPSYYMEKGSRIISEFKNSSILRNDHMGVGEYGILTTYVPWPDDTGGLLYQEYRSNGVLLTRKAYKDGNQYYWQEWSKSGLKVKYSEGMLFITDDGKNP